MLLNRDDFPDLTDEQWEKLQADVTAEGDRRATEASKTARKNAEKDAARTQQEAIDAAVAAEREKLEADEQGKLEIQRKELAKQEAEIATERRSLKATKALLAAGLPEDKVDGLLPMFVTVEDTQLETALDTFTKVYTEGVKAQVDAQKQELLGNATPPAGGTGGPADLGTAALEAANKGDEVGAVDMLLKQAGYTE